MEYTNTNRRNNKIRTKGLDFTAGLGKLPPQAVDLEEAVLGALMLEKEALNLVIDVLRAETFYVEKHQKIYKSILELFSNSEPVDIRTVVNRLRYNGDLELVGGAFYIAELTSKIQSAANIEFHARLLTQYAIKRDLIGISTDIQNQSYEDTIDVFEVLDFAEKQLFAISEKNIRRNIVPMSEVMRNALKELEERGKNKDGLTGVPSGLTELDRVTSGWQKSDLVIIAARPAMGKTAFVLSIARNAAVLYNRAVAIFSLEMSSVQLVNRLIAAEVELESEKIKKGNLADHEWVQLNKKIQQLTTAPMFIDDTPGISVLELRAKCRRLKQQHNIEMIVIDYLQLMTGDEGSRKSGNREQEISYISRSLKALAKELNVPVLALSQLSRAVETRGGDKKPMLSDLRESGAIEQDADMVCFLYRAEYYKIEVDENNRSTAGVGQIIIAKHRNGEVKEVDMRYIGKYTKFCDLDEYNYGSSGEGINNHSENNNNSGEVRLQSRINNTNQNMDFGKHSDQKDEDSFF